MSNIYEPIIWRLRGTKGHSVYSNRSYAMPVRRQTPTIAVPRLHSSFGNVRHDYGIEDSIQRADYLSNAVLEDTYEAATRSRGRDHELLRNVNAAIHTPNKSRDNTPTRSGRRTSRLRSLSPVDVKPIARPQPVVPYRNLEKVRSALAAPPAPASLLSSRIDSYLKGSSLPPRPLSRDIASNISYSSLLSRPRSPSETRPYSPQYSVYLSESHVPRSTRSSYSRSPSPYVSRVSAAREYSVGGSDDEDEEDYQIGSYRRKYKILKAPIASGPERAGSADDSEDEFYDASDYYPSYSCPRPTGVSPLKLSTYDGDYDGSYEADMAEMYDYIPYGPSKHAILELTSEDSNDSTYKPHVSTLPRLHSPSTSSTYSYSPLPKYTEDSLSRPPASRQLLDSLISNAASRAKAILENSKLPEYKNASLVLSVEGSAVSEDGRNRYGFRYYPPPIPLKGSQIGLDERILSISPKPVSDADSFLSTYLNRLRNIRTDVRDHADKSEYGRCTSVAPRPSYVHQTVTVPVHISGRPHSVPVSSYRSRLSDGQSHRVDVFPLVVSEAALPVDKKLHLPVYRAGGGDSGSPTKLTVLEKINIKAAIIGSRLETDGAKKTRRPQSEYAANKLREMKRDEIEEGIYYRTPATGVLQASRPPLSREAYSFSMPKPTERKAIRDVDGFTKPKNLLSWQYRVESRLSPDDLIYEPSSFIRMRERVKDVQDKMDRQRQLLDRYLDSDFKIQSIPSQNVEGRSSAGGDPDNLPVSDLRRRLRRTLAKSKNNPDYFRE
ncbi:uncharacterized protein LOC106057882 isoform X2 [Biomphalaria glabrata]|uniref:Uncharacterized protein LOC106057882 isoform X2 n=1 Tax=Biomphalaria glabrata TaxID=6526 RepID=A0A9W3B0Q5_BIOGL|nr:uncharacterized protein LOC106057882 isoform X2 [Biomphalaria glabrata]